MADKSGELVMSWVAWQLRPSVALTRLPFGGYVLVELDSLACHELLDAAGMLLSLESGTAVMLDEYHREFLHEAAVAGWISLDESLAENRGSRT